MFVPIYLMIGVVMRQQSISAQLTDLSNRFGTKNSYNASLELWADQPTVTKEEYIKTCCERKQVMLHTVTLLMGL